VFLVHKFQRIVAWFMPEGIEPESPEGFKTQAIVSISLLVGNSGFPFMLLFFYMQHPMEAVVVLWSWLFFMYIPFLARKQVRTSILAHLLAANYFQCHLFLCLLWGGADAPNTMWFAAMPIVSMLVGGISHGFIWGIITALSIAAIYTTEYLGLVELSTSLDPGQALFVFAAGAIGLLGAVLGSTAAFEMFRVSAMEKRLEAERDLIEANEGLKAHERELQGSYNHVENLLAQVEAANEAKSRFLAQISHELRTPLNGILGTSEAIREGIYGTLTEAQLHALDTLEQSANHQLSLVNDLLDLTKIEKGTFEPMREAVSLVELTSEVFRLLRDKANQGGIELETEGATKEIIIETDKRCVRQMLLNLIGNAIKFTPDGGSVSVSFESEEKRVSIHVRDTGIGIAQDDLPQLFEAFTQVASVYQRQYDGTGLGLSLTAKFAKLLGGDVKAASELGKGSTFTIRLPNISPKNVVPTSSEPPATIKPIKEAAPNPTEEALEGGLHVLLVDDTEANIMHVRDFLHVNGHRVSTAADGLEAIEKAQSLPDIIFMDVQMPKMDGLEAIRRLRADAHTKDLYIVSLTSFAMQEDKTRCLEAGANDYESKPVSLKKIRQLVNARKGA
jgi:signal transduction histidine kinase